MLAGWGTAGWGESPAYESGVMLPTVLVADDRPTPRVMLAALIGRHGWRVVTATNAAAAVASLRAERPRLVLLHLSSPHDVEAVRSLRAQPEGAHVPIIGIARDALARAGLSAAGATVCLTEPIDGASLLDHVRELFARPAEGPPIALPPSTEYAPQPSMSAALLREGTTILGYTVRRELGRGGYGVVYEAFDSALGRPVAIKVLYPNHLASAEDLARFRQEARALAHLAHPNVVTVYRLDEEHGLICVALEYVPGGSLRDLLNRESPLPLARVLALADGVCAGLAAVHALDIVHRDLKPENILLTPEGVPKISDFGIAHVPVSIGGLASATPAGVPLGTWLYMAPEQAAGRQVDHRADIFAVGAVLYECLAGRSHLGEAAFGPLEELVRALRSVQPEPVSRGNPAVPGSLDAIVLRALAKRPEDRWPTAAEMRAALAAVPPPRGAPPRAPAPRAEPALGETSLEW